VTGDAVAARGAASEQDISGSRGYRGSRTDVQGRVQRRAIPKPDGNEPIACKRSISDGKGYICAVADDDAGIGSA
jgi:hypothetical protein